MEQALNDASQNDNRKKLSIEKVFEENLNSSKSIPVSHTITKIDDSMESKQSTDSNKKLVGKINHNITTNAVLQQPPPPESPPPKLSPPTHIKRLSMKKMVSVYNPKLSENTPNILDFTKSIENQLSDTLQRIHDNPDKNISTAITPSNVKGIKDFKFTASQFSSPKSNISNSNNGQIITYENLLQLKDEIDRGYEALHIQESKSLAIIKYEELQSQKRLQELQQKYHQEIIDEKRLLREQFDAQYQQFVNEKEQFELEKKQFEIEKGIIETTHRDRVRELTIITNYFSKQMKEIEIEKKKLSRQRFHLDLALRDLNRLES
jgi:hypothetical protein